MSMSQGVQRVTVAQLPTASAANAGVIVWCTNGQAGSPCLAVSNGTAWVYVSDNLTAVSAT